MINKDTFHELEMSSRLNEVGVHIYYLFGWLCEPNHFMIGNPDGLIKEIILPVNDDLYKKYLALEDECPKWFTLESEARAIQHEYRGNAELFLAKEGKAFAKASFPVVVITVFYKHLFELLIKMKEYGLIRKGKIYRPIVANPGDADPYWVTRIYKGEPEKGYDEFWIGVRRDDLKRSNLYY